MRRFDSRGWTTAIVLFLLVGASATAGQEGVTPAQGGGHRDLIRVRQDLREEPWLRIDAGGHTGGIRALAFTPDSARLYSAGLDKNVEVWNLAALRDLRRVLLRERTIRWQVARGPRGSIYALAAAPNDGLLAIGGYGAMGSLGEILLVDPVQKTLAKVLEGHRQTVCALAFSSDGSQLASMDTAGETRVWKRGPWTSLVLYREDRRTYGPQRAAMIEKQPKLRPLAFLDTRHMVLPGLVSTAGEPRLRWRLLQIPIAKPAEFRTLDTIHYGMVTALGASRDGTRLASADLEGRLYLWDLARGGPPKSLSPGGIVLSLGFSPDGRTLVMGTAGDGAERKSQVQIWDVPAHKPARNVQLLDAVHACAVSPDGKRLAYTGGASGELFVEPLDGSQKSAVLSGTGRRIGKVAFAMREPLCRVAFGTAVPGGAFNDYAELQETFDPVQLSRGGEVPVAADWIPADWSNHGWTVRQRDDGSLQLLRGGVPQGQVMLGPQLPGLEEGRPRCYCWVPDATGQPYAIAVGTDVQNSIYVCRLAERGPCPILRHFRGHHDSVNSVGVSRDLRYLVSSSTDGTVRFWSLADYAQGTTPWGRWGATFAVRGDELRVTDIHPAGPLYGKGMRKGNVLLALCRPTERGEQTERRAAAMAETLASSPWGTQLVFEHARNGVAPAQFQLLPAWQPLATLFVNTDGEWAFWTPEGYYDASMNGHRLFGWQVNRGLQRLPDYYRADQFYKELERPDVMEKLLGAGSLHEALRQAAVTPKVAEHEVLVAQIEATPRVEILTPVSGETVREITAKVKARIELPAGRRLVQAQAFANGVAATKEELLSERDVEGGKERVYQWDLPLPSDPKNLIQVVAGTDAPTAAFSSVVVERVGPAQPAKPPRMHVLALGINQYGDPQIQSLAYPVADARAVVDLLRARATGLYALDEVTLLSDRDVTPARWTEVLHEVRTRLKDNVKPDDLLVFFLAGHGIVDESTRKYYFVGRDFTLAALNQQVFTECISWDDFRLLADVPCRKVALLDTCHSGAIQPLRSRDLKAAVRELQADVIITVTASTGEQRAAEKSEWQHGAFTKCLLEALMGKADQSRDGTVTLEELVPYVKESVSRLTGGLQTPTAAPDEILPFTAIPLTRSR